MKALTREQRNARLISPPDGRVVETLTDTRVLCAVAGVTLGNAGEKALFRAARQLFGVAVPGPSQTVKYHPAKSDGTADTSQESPQFRINRNVARVAGVIGAVAAIEYSNSEEVQYSAIGAAALWGCHILQDLIPPIR